MQSKNYTKLKLLYIQKFLEEFSDEDNPMSVERMTELLLEVGIECEKKSIYSDVKTIREFGVDVITTKAPINGYYIANREFQLPEVKLLADAMQSANFITPKKTDELIEKICTLCSQSQAKYVKNQQLNKNNLKCTNEEIYYTIDLINKAILQNKQIKFTYCKKRLNKSKKTVDTIERQHMVSPYSTIWENGYYYLVSNNEKYDNLMHTRIDKMKKVSISRKKSRDFSEVCADLDESQSYHNKVFNMYSGEMMEVELVFTTDVLEKIMERFGLDEKITICSNKLTMTTQCAVSDGLASWLMRFGSDVEVVSPQCLIDMIKDKAKAICELYE